MSKSKRYYVGYFKNDDNDNELYSHHGTYEEVEKFINDELENRSEYNISCIQLLDLDPQEL